MKFVRIGVTLHDEQHDEHSDGMITAVFDVEKKQWSFSGGGGIYPRVLRTLADLSKIVIESGEPPR